MYIGRSLALHIISSEADRLARKLAKQHGETITEAVVTALKERLARTDTRQIRDREKRKANILKLLEEMDKYPVLDSRSAEEILGYDENGLPT
jgi:antitoxin VapB